jgi:hypothetical protein
VLATIYFAGGGHLQTHMVAGLEFCEALQEQWRLPMSLENRNILFAERNGECTFETVRHAHTFASRQPASGRSDTARDRRGLRSKSFQGGTRLSIFVQDTDVSVAGILRAVPRSHAGGCCTGWSWFGQLCSKPESEEATQLPHSCGLSHV